MIPLVISVQQADGGTRRYAFAESPVTIGRSPFADLQLPEPFVSRWEGTLRFDETELTYFHLGATNSTFVDDRTLAEHEEDVALSVDSVLKLGELKLRFSREPVPDCDIRYKGARNPARDNAATGIQTVYLEASNAWAPPPKAFRGQNPAATDLPAGSSNMGDTLYDPPELEFDTPVDPGLAKLLNTQRQTRAAILAAIHAQLHALPPAQQGRWLRQLLTAEPTLGADPDLRETLQALGVAAPADTSELSEWLAAIKGDLLPDGVEFDPQLTLRRVLGLLEALVQSLAEIHDAQDTVRKRWLGRSARRSLLQSDNGTIVLAYLLNPQANWSQRLSELEQCVREVVTHELALFRATLDGAHDLLQAISPEAIEQSLYGAGGAVAAERDHGNLISRWLRRPVREKALWERFETMHTTLLDEARYERVFLGRSFARSYLSAMGKPGHTDKRASSGRATHKPLSTRQLAEDGLP